MFGRGMRENVWCVVETTICTSTTSYPIPAGEPRWTLRTFRFFVRGIIFRSMTELNEFSEYRYDKRTNKELMRKRFET